MSLITGEVIERDNNKDWVSKFCLICLEDFSLAGGTMVVSMREGEWANFRIFQEIHLKLEEGKLSIIFLVPLIENSSAY